MPSLTEEPRTVLGQNEAEEGGDDMAEIENFPMSPFPHDLKPMRSAQARDIEDPEEWLYEPVTPGLRCFANVHSGKVSIRKPHGANLENPTSELVKILKSLDQDVVLDGVLSNDDGEDVFTVVDIPWIDGRDVQDAPLELRRSMLTQLIGQDNSFLQAVDVFDVAHPEEMKNAMESDVEIIAKRKHSVYVPGVTSLDWLHLGRAYDLETDDASPWKKQLYKMLIGGGLLVDSTSRKQEQREGNDKKDRDDTVAPQDSTHIERHSDDFLEQRPATTTVYDASKIVTTTYKEQAREREAVQDDIDEEALRQSDVQEDFDRVVDAQEEIARQADVQEDFDQVVDFQEEVARQADIQEDFEQATEPELLAATFSRSDDEIAPIGEVAFAAEAIAGDDSLRPEVGSPTNAFDSSSQTDGVDEDIDYLMDPAYHRAQDASEIAETSTLDEELAADGNLPAVLVDDNGPQFSTEQNQESYDLLRTAAAADLASSQMPFTENERTQSLNNVPEVDSIETLPQRADHSGATAATVEVVDLNVQNGEAAQEAVASHREEGALPTSGEATLYSGLDGGLETASMRVSGDEAPKNIKDEVPRADTDLQPLEMHIQPNDPRLMNLDPRLQPLDHRWDTPNERDINFGIGPGSLPEEQSVPSSGDDFPAPLATSFPTPRVATPGARNNFVSDEIATIAAKLPADVVVPEGAPVRSQILEVRRSIDQTRNQLIADARDGFKELNQQEGKGSDASLQHDQEREQLKKLTFELDARADQALAELSEVMNYVDDSGNIRPDKQVRVERLFDKAEKNVEFLSSHDTFVNEIVNPPSQETDLDLGLGLDLQDAPADSEL